MDPVDLAFLPIQDLHALIRLREIAPIRLADVFLNRIAAQNDKSNAYIAVANDRALEEARSVASRLTSPDIDRLPLSGIPYACKDVFLTRSVPTTAGSKVIGNWSEDNDSEVVRRMTAAGRSS